MADMEGVKNKACLSFTKLKNRKILALAVASF